MPEKVVPGPVQDNACIREAVCIHTKKIFDSCREEDITSYRKSSPGHDPGLLLFFWHILHNIAGLAL
mgnify:FL=1